MEWAPIQLPLERDDVALDGADVRVLARGEHASTIHCALGAGKVSQATFNQGIDETWYFISGSGRMAMWAVGKPADRASVFSIAPGASLVIPRDVNFQYRADEVEELCFICFVVPPWPGPAANRKSLTAKWRVPG